MIDPPRSRNDPCPCGSGLRYKHCHGATGAAPPGAGVVAHAPPGSPPGDAERPAGALARAQAELASGNRAAAEALCRSILAAAPNDPAAWNLLGEALRATAPSEAEAAWRRALEIESGNAEARFHLGNLYRERGEARAAIVEYEQALAAAPGHAGLLNNLGLALEAAGDRDRAEACYREVLAADPGQPEALGNLASVRFERDDFEGAAAAYDQLFALRRDFPAAIWTRRGIAQHKLRAWEAAEASFREGVRLAPDDARVHYNLALLLADRQRHADAEPALRRTLELEPGHRAALGLLAITRQNLCAWDGIESLFAEIARVLEDEPETVTGLIPFPVLTMSPSPLVQLRAAQRWAAAIAPPVPAPRPELALRAGERLRVGYVSSDFRPHPMIHLQLQHWEGTDRRRIETFAYGIMPEDKGPVGQSVARAFEHFVDVSADSTDAIVERIRNDRIAILVDLNGYTKDSRDAIFAQRPAPIQINIIGYPGTLGADWYDYILVDRFGAPESMQWAYVERLFHGPQCSFPSDIRRAPAGPPPSRAECGLPDAGFVFCCFNNAFKILPDVFAIWMRLLRAVPDSCLWLLAAREAEQNLRREAERAGVAPARIVFAPRTSSEKHLARIAAADLVVDTFPYGAHTTANDALLVGVPIVTCAGETLASRIAGSHLHAIGLPELVASNFADYEALALRLARHPDELAALRRRLAANRNTHPLFDIPRYTRDFEDALLRIWREHTAATPSG
jgi:protein O-GlcNAc transferase